MVRIALLTLALTACGTDQERETVVAVGPEPGSCTAAQTEGGATIVCPDGSSLILTNGKDGARGPKGETGATGPQGAPGKDGTDGIDGIDGQDGVDGKDGKNVSAVGYIGYYCGRVVVKIGHIRYVLNSMLVPLTNEWLYISSSCDIRYKNGKIETR